MSTLAHVLEAAGLSTVVLASMRDVVERMHPPRALYCEFPLGRPLGKPADPDFQRDVLMHALALLEAEAPVIADYPEVIVAEEVPMACPVPALLDGDLPPCVEEAQGLRAAYDRALARRGVTSVGRVIDADGVPAALEVLHRLGQGFSLDRGSATRQEHHRGVPRHPYLLRRSRAGVGRWPAAGWAPGRNVVL